MDNVKKSQPKSGRDRHTNKHPFKEINYGSGKEVHDETIKDTNEPLQIKWFNDSFIKIPIWKE